MKKCNYWISLWENFLLFSEASKIEAIWVWHRHRIKLKRNFPFFKGSSSVKENETMCVSNRIAAELKLLFDLSTCLKKKQNWNFILNCWLCRYNNCGYRFVGEKSVILYIVVLVVFFLFRVFKSSISILLLCFVVNCPTPTATTSSSPSQVFHFILIYAWRLMYSISFHMKCGGCERIQLDLKER